VPELPAGFAVRTATADDLDAIIELFDAYDVWDFGRTDTVREHLEADWVAPGFDPAADSWLVTEEGRVVVGFAYALGPPIEQVWEALGRVHPDHRGRGIGAFLVGAAEDRARQRPGAGPPAIRNSVTATDEEARALLEGRGYRRVRVFWHMERTLGEERDPPPIEGIVLRPMRGGEERAVHAVMEDSFAEHWGQPTAPFEDWRLFMDQPGFDPGMAILAVEREEIVGGVVSMMVSDAAWVRELGVRPAWRGRGIGTALLSSAFADLSRRGVAEVRLNVDAGNETGATRLYERAGMTIRRQWLAYEKPLGG
jgi:mycothiol synthase